MDFELTTLQNWRKIELVDRITQKLDKGELPLALFLDLSKVFDTLNHEILLTKLRHCGILSNQ